MHQVNWAQRISSTHSARRDVRALLRALGDGWQVYLPAAHDLGEADMQVYLAEQGYERLRDLLAHATAWGEETLGVVAVWRRGGEMQRYDDHDFNAQAVARLSLYSSAEVERRFIHAYAALSYLLAFLQDDALAQASVYEWMVTTIVEHFNDHRPPNMPALR